MKTELEPQSCYDALLRNTTCRVLCFRIRSRAWERGGFPNYLISNFGSLILVLAVLLSINVPETAFAQQKTKTIDITGFHDSAHHWKDITDHEQVIVRLKNQKKYKPTQIRKIADNIILYQQPNGGWPKNYDMLAILTSGQKRILAEKKDSDHTTFDNGATHSQIEYLAHAYTMTRDSRYKDAALRGINFILRAQYPNGGWPQFYPDTSGYRKYITFNDDAMVGVMTVLHHIVQNKSYYSFVGNTTREKVRKAFWKGIDCILMMQIKEDGELTVWCQQHDNETLKPRGARTFELPCKASEESAQIVELLMSIDHPSQKVIQSVQSAVRWFKDSEIDGIRIKTVAARKVIYKFHEADSDKVVVKDSSAPPIWARYYELGTNRPFFANRDGKKVYKLSDVSRERRTGYGWYGYWPEHMLKEYPEWGKENLN